MRIVVGLGACELSFVQVVRLAGKQSRMMKGAIRSLFGLKWGSAYMGCKVMGRYVSEGGEWVWWGCSVKK